MYISVFLLAISYYELAVAANIPRVPPFFFFFSGEYPFLTVYRGSTPPPQKHILCGLTAKLWPIDCISCSINWRCSGSLIYGRKVGLVKTKVLGEMGVIECRLHGLVVAIAGSNLEGGYSPDILLLKAQALWTSGSDSRVLSGGGYSPDIARAGYSRDIQSKRRTPRKEKKKRGYSGDICRVTKQTRTSADPTTSTDRSSHSTRTRTEGVGLVFAPWFCSSDIQRSIIMAQPTLPIVLQTESI